MKRTMLFPVYGLVLLMALFAVMLGSNLHTWRGRRIYHPHQYTIPI